MQQFIADKLKLPGRHAVGRNNATLYHVGETKVKGYTRCAFNALRVYERRKATID